MLNLRSSDGIRCISAGMIAPVKCCTINVYMASAAGISFSPWEDAGERSYVDGLGATRGLPRSSDGIRCICAGMITRVKCCTINVYMNSAAGISCNTWEDAGERSDAVLWDLVANNKEEKQRKKETTVKKRCNTRTSQEVTHPSTCLAQARLIADAGMITPVKCCTINVYMASAAGISFNTWEDAGERSEMDGLGPKKPKCNTMTSQEVTHPSTTLAQPCLTADAGMIAPVKCCTINVYMASAAGISFSLWEDAGERSYAVLWDLVANNKKEKQRKKEKNVKKGATRGLPRSSDGIGCISAGMITPVKCCTINVYMNSAVGISCNTWEDAGERSDAVLWDLVANNKEEKQRKKEKNVKKKCNTRTSQEVTHPSTTRAQARLTADAGMIAPVRYCRINVYMASEAGISFNNWENAGKRSDAVLWDLVANKKDEKQRKKEKSVKKKSNTRTSQEVTHSSTTLASARLTADVGMIAPVRFCMINVYMASAAGISFNNWENAGKRSDVYCVGGNLGHRCKYQGRKITNTRTSQEVTHPSTTLAQAHLTADVGMIAPVMYCTINVYMGSAAGICFKNWETAGKRSDSVLWDLVGNKKDEKQRKKEKNVKKRCNKRTSQEVTHPSTTLAQPCLTCGCWYDRTCQVLHDQCIYGFGSGYKFQPLGRRGRAKLRGWFGSEKAIAVLWDLVANNKEEKQRKKEKNVKKGATRGLPRSSDGIRCICAGMITRVKCCKINVYMNSAAGISCNTWDDAGERSDAVLWDLVANNKEEKQRKKETTVKKRCNTRTSLEVTHPSTCLAQARLIADTGMITPVKCCTINVYMASAAGISFNTWEDAGERSEMDGLEKNVKRRCNTRTSQEVTHPSTTLAQPCLTADAGMIAPVKCCTINCSGYKFQPLGRRGRAKLRGWFGRYFGTWLQITRKKNNVKKKGISDGIRCISAGMIKLVKCCTINVYMNSAVGISCNTWEDAGERSDAVLWDLVANNKEEKQRKKEKNVKKKCNTRTSQEVTHPSTTRAQARLTADAGMIAPVRYCTINVYMASEAGISFNNWENAGKRSDVHSKSSLESCRRYFVTWLQIKITKNNKSNTRTSQEVTHSSTTLASARLTADVGMIAPVRYCMINVYMASAAGISFNNWENAGKRSDVYGVGGNLGRRCKYQGRKITNTRTSQEVTHPSTTLAQAHLTADVGMIPPVRYCTINVYMGSAAGICFKNWETAGKRSDVYGLEKNVKKKSNTRTSQEVTHPSTTLAQAHLTALYCTIHVYMAWATGTSLNTWEDAGERSDAVLWDFVANNKDIKKRKKEKNVKKRCNRRTSQEVTHPGTTLAQARLTVDF
ncbi:hypothetical protein V8G54_037651 [Vigna mungo]|uniref:Uncharacterized protein n=2 Tax=Vigna mungo TaxID=3915 RepID=A0AAQ3MJ95_VIGMU